MKNKMDISTWVQMFKDIGLDDKAMDKWHQLFESRHPESHQSFLEWLGASEEKIKEIRTNSR